MTDEKPKEGESEQPTIQVLQEIRDGLRDPKELSPLDRQRCVDFLKNDGGTVASIANFLQRSEKTISRDLKAIDAQYSLSPSIEFAQRFVGQFYRYGMDIYSHLIRLLRTEGISVSEKVQAIFAAWKILKELTEKMQTLGYLPLKPTEITGDLYHHDSEEKSHEEVRKMISEIEKAAKETNSLTPELSAEIAELNARLERTEVVLKAKQITEQQSSGSEEPKEN